MKELRDVVTWLKQWFYDTTQIDNLLSNKANKNLTNANMNVVTDSSGNISTEAKPVIPDVSGKIDTAGTGLSKSGTTLNHSNSITAQATAVFKKFSFDGQGHITGTGNVSSSDLPSHSHSLDNVTDDQIYTYISPSGSTIRATFTAIDTAIGNIGSIRAIEVTSNKGTASSDKLGKLFIVNENSKVNVYYVKQTGTGSSATYSWQKMDTDILDELVVNWSDVQNNPFSSSTPSSFANATHYHDDSYIAVTFRDIETGWGVNSQYGFNGEAYDRITSLEGDIITSIALVPKNTDANGKIIFYTGDEPS